MRYDVEYAGAGLPGVGYVEAQIEHISRCQLANA
jgi:hypothetical protein